VRTCRQEFEMSAEHAGKRTLRRFMIARRSGLAKISLDDRSLIN